MICNSVGLLGGGGAGGLRCWSIGDHHTPRLTHHHRLHLLECSTAVKRQSASRRRTLLDNQESRQIASRGHTQRETQLPSELHVRGTEALVPQSACAGSATA